LNLISPNTNAILIDIDEEEEDLSAESTLQVPKVLGYKRKGGMPVSENWSMMTDDLNPHKLKTLKCKWCKDIITTDHKVKNAERHLKHCRLYKNSSTYIDSLPADAKKVALMKNGSMKSYAIKVLTKGEQETFHTHIAEFFYLTGTSFQRVGCPKLKQAIEGIRPGCTLPTRDRLANELLDKSYENMNQKVAHLLSLSTTYSCVTSDGWTDNNGNSILTYNSYTDFKDIFLESVETKLNRHSAVYLQEDFERVLKSIDSTPNSPKVAGFVTDNTSTNRLMWDQLLLKYPSKYFYGCAAHALQLIVKWIFKKQPVKKAVTLTPMQQPF
jgi:hypothetical protein